MKKGKYLPSVVLLSADNKVSNITSFLSSSGLCKFSLFSASAFFKFESWWDEFKLVEEASYKNKKYKNFCICYFVLSGSKMFY